MNTDYTGMVFGFWRVVRKTKKKCGRSFMWLCECKCKRQKAQLMMNLKSGTSKSCGCGVYRVRNAIHGLSSKDVRKVAPEYRARTSLKQRCLNPNTPHYSCYGGRGIKVCAFIRDEPTSILHLIGKRPCREMTVDRIDNDLHYSCGSCYDCKTNKWKMNIRWATRMSQSLNRRTNVILTLNGITKTAGEFAKQAGIDPSRFYKKVKKGVSPDTLLKLLKEA